MTDYVPQEALHGESEDGKLTIAAPNKQKRREFSTRMYKMVSDFTAHRHYNNETISCSHPQHSLPAQLVITTR